MYVFNMAIPSKHCLREFASKFLGNFKKITRNKVTSYGKAKSQGEPSCHAHHLSRDLKLGDRVRFSCKVGTTQVLYDFRIQPSMKIIIFICQLPIGSMHGMFICLHLP